MGNRDNKRFAVAARTGRTATGRGGRTSARSRGVPATQEFIRGGPSRAEAIAERANRRLTRFARLAVFVGCAVVLLPAGLQNLDLERFANDLSAFLDAPPAREVAEDQPAPAPPFPAPPFPAPPPAPIPPTPDEGQLQERLRSSEASHGPDHPATASVLYQLGFHYSSVRQPEKQEQAWLRTLSILQQYPGQMPERFFAEGFDGSVDREKVARRLGRFYWDQYQYAESYNYYDLAYGFAADVLDEADRNRRLAYNSAGVMAGACLLQRWEVADKAMEELKERIMTVPAEDLEPLQYWIDTGEPRLETRRC